MSQLSLVLQIHEREWGVKTDECRNEGKGRGSHWTKLFMIPLVARSVARRSESCRSLGVPRCAAQDDELRVRAGL